MLDVLLGCGLGLLQGTRHALEPDHVAAVSTLIAEERRSRLGTRLALAWATGHALSLVGLSFALFSLRIELPPRLADAFELLAALMLLALGLRALLSLGRGRLEPERHGEVSAGALLRPVGVGLVHGVAGSGALAALAAARAPSALGTLLFMLVYALGAGAGMVAVVHAAGRPLGKLAVLRQSGVVLPGLTGALSVLVGLAWGLPIAVRLWA